jgi:RNA polymerase sigma-70 factor (ECF subfamily)
VRPWLLTIVANEARNRRRSAGRREHLALRAAQYAQAGAAGEARPSGEAAHSPERALLAGELRATLIDALNRLREEDRLVLGCRFLLDLSEAETAAALGVRRGTVKSRTSRALERLRAVMEPAAAREGVTPRA